MQTKINVAGESFVLETDTPEKIKKIQKFIEDRLKKAYDATGRNDNKMNLAYAYLELTIELWDKIKEDYSITDGVPNVLSKIEVPNDKVMSKIKELRDVD